MHNEKESKLLTILTKSKALCAQSRARF